MNLWKHLNPHNLYLYFLYYLSVDKCSCNSRSLLTISVVETVVVKSHDSKNLLRIF